MAVANRERLVVDAARRLLPCRAAAVVHAVRAADGADPVEHHRRPRRHGFDAARLLAVAVLRARHGGHVHRGRRTSPRSPASRFRRCSRNPGSSRCSPALFVVLALGMFGLFELQMPAAIQTRLANMANQQKGGHVRRHRHHWRTDGADRHDLRRAAVDRRAQRSSARPATLRAALARCSRSAWAWARRCCSSAHRPASCCRESGRG